MLIYTIELNPRGNGGADSEMWRGPAINMIDAIQKAKQSVFPKLHTATVVEIGEHANGEQEGNQSRPDTV